MLSAVYIFALVSSLLKIRNFTTEDNGII